MAEVIPHKKHSLRRQATVIVAALLAVYLTAAYLFMPELWQHYVRKHPALDHAPGITLTKVGIPGDPINVSLVGTQREVVRIMLKAGWYPADPITLRSSLEIAAASLLKRPYDDAPVSSLYLYGRKEDLAFEQPVGPDPRQRNHVRFWKSDKSDADGRPVWLGAATFDRGIGLSHTTGEITHHIAPNVDGERNHLFEDLARTGLLSENYVVVGFHKKLLGKNGGGDPWYTDGNLRVGVIRPDARSSSIERRIGD